MHENGGVKPLEPSIKGITMNVRVVNGRGNAPQSVGISSFREYMEKQYLGDLTALVASALRAEKVSLKSKYPRLAVEVLGATIIGAELVYARVPLLSYGPVRPMDAVVKVVFELEVVDCVGEIKHQGVCQWFRVLGTVDFQSMVYTPSGDVRIYDHKVNHRIK